MKTRKPGNVQEKIIWFSLTCSKNASTKVGNQFLKLINKHFPWRNKFYKLLNKNKVKVSYSCMPNMKNIINAHNKKLINHAKDIITRTCHCTRKHQCWFNEKCLTNNALCNVSITRNKDYYDVSETTFKLRYANHKKKFSNIKYQTDTEISNKYWNIISTNKTLNISWEILGTHKWYICSN